MDTLAQIAEYLRRSHETAEKIWDTTSDGMGVSLRSAFMLGVMKSIAERAAYEIEQAAQEQADAAARRDARLAEYINEALDSFGHDHTGVALDRLTSALVELSSPDREAVAQ